MRRTICAQSSQSPHSWYLHVSDIKHKPWGHFKKLICNIGVRNVCMYIYKSPSRCYLWELLSFKLTKEYVSKTLISYLYQIIFRVLH